MVCEILGLRNGNASCCSSEQEGRCSDCEVAWEFFNEPLPRGASGKHVEISFPHDGNDFVNTIRASDGDKITTYTHRIHEGTYTREVQTTATVHEKHI